MSVVFQYKQFYTNGTALYCINFALCFLRNVEAESKFILNEPQARQNIIIIIPKWSRILHFKTLHRQEFKTTYTWSKLNKSFATLQIILRNTW